MTAPRSNGHRRGAERRDASTLSRPDGIASMERGCPFDDPAASTSAMGSGVPFLNGFPVYVLAARAFVVIVDPKLGQFTPGVDETGDGHLNVRALSQICPHLGCRPNPCIEDFWFHCPCHQSRYDRLGIKPAGTGFGPAERGMDRFALEVDDAGVLTIDTSHLTLGPLPIPLGQPGVIPPLVPHERACK